MAPLECFNTDSEEADDQSKSTKISLCGHLSGPVWEFVVMDHAKIIAKVLLPVESSLEGSAVASNCDDSNCF